MQLGKTEEHPNQSISNPDPRADESLGRLSFAALIVSNRLACERAESPKIRLCAGLGSILDTVSKDTEDTAQSRILSVSKIHFQQTFINGSCI